MKVLIISHNVFSATNNMGRTMLSYFSGFKGDEIAQFYIQEKDPSDGPEGVTYYRFTDREALKSLAGKKGGQVLGAQEDSGDKTLLSSTEEAIRQYGRRRNTLVYLMRNAVWKLSRWDSDELRQWIRDFDPEVIFFMAGDYGFMYDIAMTVKKMMNIPMVVCCVDDYYIYNRNGSSLVGRWQHARFMKKVTETMRQSSCILTVSRLMARAYQRLFDRPCHFLPSGTAKRSVPDGSGRHGIAYFGNLGGGRARQLSAVGTAVSELRQGSIDVYSGEGNTEILQELTAREGVSFHGQITAEEVNEKMDRALAVIHTESFDPDVREMVRYSVSTKIADLLMNGPVIVAYGPEDVASIAYLKENSAALVISCQEDLKPQLRILLEDGLLREQITANARRLAKENHDEAAVSRKVRKWLAAAIKDHQAEGKGE